MCDGMMEGMIIFVTGRKGSGKTLTMVKDAINYSYDGLKIYSNFQTSVSQKILSNKEILQMDRDTDLQDCVLLIDEIQILFDSRRSPKKENIGFSNFIQQIRKRGIILIASTQYSGTVDLRFRQHVDILVKPRHYKNYDVCEVTYIDLNSIDEDNTEPSSVTMVFDARTVYNSYNTKERILI